MTFQESQGKRLSLNTRPKPPCHLSWECTLLEHGRSFAVATETIKALPFILIHQHEDLPILNRECACPVSLWNDQPEIAGSNERIGLVESAKALVSESRQPATTSPFCAFRTLLSIHIKDMARRTLPFTSHTAAPLTNEPHNSGVLNLQQTLKKSSSNCALASKASPPAAQDCCEVLSSSKLRPSKQMIRSPESKTP